MIMSMPESFYAAVAELGQQSSDQKEQAPFFVDDVAEAPTNTEPVGRNPEFTNRVLQAFDGVKGAAGPLEAAIAAIRERINNLPTRTAEQPVKTITTATTVEDKTVISDTNTKEKTPPYIIEQTLYSMWESNKKENQPVFTPANQEQLLDVYSQRLETVPVPELGLFDRFRGWLGRVTSYRIGEPSWTKAFITEQAITSSPDRVPYRRAGSRPTQWVLDSARIQNLTDTELEQRFTAAEQYVARAHRQQQAHQVATLPVGIWEQKVYSALVQERIRRLNR